VAKYTTIDGKLAPRSLSRIRENRKQVGRTCTSPFEDPYYMYVIFGYNPLNFRGIPTKSIYIVINLYRYNPINSNILA